MTVCDREADVYEFISKSLLEEKRILIRVVHDRRVFEEQMALSVLVDSCPKAGKILIDIPGDTRGNLPHRQATFAVKFLQATLWPTFGKARITMGKPCIVWSTTGPFCLKRCPPWRQPSDS